MYDQIDRVSMGSLLGPLMANVIMTELERGIVKGLFNINKFYIRYMDGTLVLMKKSNVPIVLQALGAFHKNLNFAFEDKNDFLIF